MNKFLKIIILTSVLLFSSCVNDSNPEDFTAREYKKIRKEITEYFENEEFTCKNEVDKYEKEAWADSQGRDNNEKYIEPTVCRKITEKKIDGNVYKSEIKYKLISYDWMVYSKKTDESDQFTLNVESTIVPKEKLMKEDIILSFYQQTGDSFLYLNYYKYDKTSYEIYGGHHTYVALSSLQNNIENYEYFQNIFLTDLPEDVRLESSTEEIEYFYLTVDKGYVENLLDENKIIKTEADEIATKFEKSEIYDKIYNLKY